MARYRIEFATGKMIKISAEDYYDMTKKLIDRLVDIPYYSVKSVKTYFPTSKKWIECGRIGL